MDGISIAAIIAALGFLFGVFQYWKAQKWKVAEFVANEMKAFEEDPLTTL